MRSIKDPYPDDLLIRKSWCFCCISFLFSASNGYFLHSIWNSEEKSNFAAEENILAAVVSLSLKKSKQTQIIIKSREFFQRKVCVEINSLLLKILCSVHPFPPLESMFLPSATVQIILSDCFKVISHLSIIWLQFK